MEQKVSSFSAVCKVFLSPHQKALCSTFPAVEPDKSNKPYKERGERLRARRYELQECGKLPTLRSIASTLGVRESSILMWERGETWPTKTKRDRLAALLGWSVQQLDYGPQFAQSTTGEQMLHPVTPTELSLLALYRALRDEDRQSVLDDLRARTITLQTLASHVGGPVKPAPDARVEAKFGTPPPRIPAKRR